MDPARDDPVIAWLLSGDPAIRWQVLRDLVDGPAEATDFARAQIATQGWGRRLLELRGPDGRWAGGLYSPKWTSTTYTLLLLRAMGLSPQTDAARQSAQVLLDQGDWVDGGVVFWRSGQVDLCVVGLVLSIAAYFELPDTRVGDLVDVLSRHQAGDGSWRDGLQDVSHRPFHVAIAALEGLAEYQRHRPVANPEVTAMMAAGHEFLLHHRLFRSVADGGVIDPAWTRFSFPPHWHYDVLRALDHLNSVGVQHEVRLNDALDLLVSRRRPDGTWPLQSRHPGRTWFDLETVGGPSRWNTLRALRVLRSHDREGSS
jgi:hypothetical protein